MAIFEGVIKKSKNLMLGYEKSDVGITPTLLKLNFRHHTPKNSIFSEKLRIYLLVKIFRLEVNIRNFPLSAQKNFHVSTIQQINRIKIHEMRAKSVCGLNVSGYCTNRMVLSPLEIYMLETCNILT